MNTVLLHLDRAIEALRQLNPNTNSPAKLILCDIETARANLMRHVTPRMFAEYWTDITDRAYEEMGTEE